MFSNIDKNGVIKYEYNTSYFNFKDIISRYVNTCELESVNEYFTESYNVINDQSSDCHKAFYDRMKNDPKQQFIKKYKDFVKSLFNKNWLYQTTPTIRFHYPNNLAVGGFHRDSDYNHSKEEINIFVPVTKAFDTNTFWIESEIGKEDYKPIEADYGQIVIFDGANKEHGNYINKTGKTRVSFDFRVLHKTKYIEDNKKSITQDRKFVIGDYWTEL